MGQTNRQSWALALAARNDVRHIVYVETLGWNPLGLLSKPKQIGNTIVVLRAWNLMPYAGRPRARASRAVNTWLTGYVVRRYLRSRKISVVDLLVAFDPLSWRLVRKLPARVSIYDCLDLYEAQPQYEKSRNALGVEEKRTILEVDRVTVSSCALETLMETRGATEVLFVAGSVIPLQLPVLPIPKRSQTAPFRTSAVYVGAIDEYKLDIEVFLRLLDMDSSLEITLIGRSVLGRVESMDMRRLREHPRAVFMPPIERRELGWHLESYDFGLVAMSKSVYSQYSFPLKVWDYLACGLPVLSVGSPALSKGVDGVVAVNRVEDISVHTFCTLRSHMHRADVLRRTAAENSAYARIDRILNYARSE